MAGVEIDMVVTDSLKALELYKKIFEIETVEASDFPRGENEAIFTLYDVPFHLLDENPAFHLTAPPRTTRKHSGSTSRFLTSWRPMPKPSTQAAMKYSRLRTFLITACRTLFLWIPLATSGCCIRCTWK